MRLMFSLMVLITVLLSPPCVGAEPLKKPADERTAQGATTQETETGSPKPNLEAELSQAATMPAESADLEHLDVLLDDLGSARAQIRTLAPIEKPAPCNTDSDHYFRLELLYWELTNPNENGIVVASSDNSIFTTGQENTDHRFGFRLMLGGWSSPRVGWEVGGFWIQPYEFSPHFVAGDATVILVPNNEDLASAFFVHQTEMHGMESNLRFVLDTQGMLTFDALLGFRYIDLDESLDIGLAPSTGGTIHETFDIENSLFGVQWGAETTYNVSRYVSLRGGVKTGVAANFATINIGGPSPGSGRFTGQRNLGVTKESDYVAFFDLGIAAIFQVTRNCQLHVGYSGLWVGEVARALDQLNLTGLEVEAGPTLGPRVDKIWLSGFNTGLRIDY